MTQSIAEIGQIQRSGRQEEAKVAVLENTYVIPLLAIHNMRPDPLMQNLGRKCYILGMESKNIV